jgi:hypothetical protein
MLQYDVQGDRPDDEGGKYLWNIGKFLTDYTVQYHRRRPSSANNFLLCARGVVSYTAGE